MRDDFLCRGAELTAWRGLVGRSVQVLFATAGVMRHYALHSAPLTRAEFRPGQRVTGNKQTLMIERVSEADGLFTYHAGDRALQLGGMHGAGMPGGKGVDRRQQ